VGGEGLGRPEFGGGSWRRWGGDCERWFVWAWPLLALPRFVWRLVWLLIEAGMAFEVFFAPFAVVFFFLLIVSCVGLGVPCVLITHGNGH